MFLAVIELLTTEEKAKITKILTTKAEATRKVTFP